MILIVAILVHYRLWRTDGRTHEDCILR